MSTDTPARPDARRHPRGPVRRWLLEGLRDPVGTHPGPHAPTPERTHPWWRVMCLTGVDYFSTLGYQPAIAALAAGVLSPLATIVLIAVTLFGALPVYRWVARESYRGEGSIAMLERLLPWWGGKLFVLVLLGFAATDFMITMTLSAADASAHAIENPFAPEWLQGTQVPMTLVLLALLAAVFLRGFTEAIGVAVVLVAVFLGLNAVVIAASFGVIAADPGVVGDWWTALATQHGDPVMAVAVALIVFPKLALGLSGFETGVAVMPQIRDDGDPASGPPVRRIRGAARLLTTAALIMSAFLLTSSIATTLLIPEREFQPGGSANGRALAYLAHEHLGEVFGTVYDVSTIAILWFAGASAMAGLLNLVPRFLPRYGMAPHWAAAVRPLVLVFTAIGFLITWVFDASVDAQGAAYATGVLVLITSASIAVLLSAIRRRRRGATVGFAVIVVVFLYTTVLNVIERPEGVRIAGLFILGIVVVSVLSRVQRSFQLRATSVTLDAIADDWVSTDAEEQGRLRLLCHEPLRTDASVEERADAFRRKLVEERRTNAVPVRSPLLFIEVLPADSSDFEEDLMVRGVVVDGYRVLQVASGNVPNTIAAVLLELRDRTGVVPDVFFGWTEGNPVGNFLRYLVTGVGENAPVTREVLRRAEPDPRRRPDVHVS